MNWNWKNFSYGRLLAFIAALNLIGLTWHGVVTEGISLFVGAGIFILLAFVGTLAYYSNGGAR